MKKDVSFLGVNITHDNLKAVLHTAIDIKPTKRRNPNRTQAVNYLLQLGYEAHLARERENKNNTIAKRCVSSTKNDTTKSSNL